MRMLTTGMMADKQEVLALFVEEDLRGKWHA